ncbi:hypothetical protein M3Y97_01131600 [Aphelenchoides bicaudatus]|nr:hypothetical protein M3Y97_01131600 [Aphelenchoides bicaudatus]
MKIPPAANMYKLTYSKKLEKKALKLAQACNTDLGLGFTYFVMDTSPLPRGEDPPPDFLTLVPNAMLMWWSMFSDYRTTYTDSKTRIVQFKRQPLLWNETSKYALYNKTVREGLGTEFGQFFGGKASQIGCGVNTCNNVTGVWSTKMSELNLKYNASTFPFVVCAYKKKISFGRPLYKKGKKMKCPKGSVANKKTHLCIIKRLKAIHK